MTEMPHFDTAMRYRTRASAYARLIASYMLGDQSVGSPFPLHTDRLNSTLGRWIRLYEFHEDMADAFITLDTATAKKSVAATNPPAPSSQ